MSVWPQRAICFTMQTPVILFHFAWSVYCYGTLKMDKLRATGIRLPLTFFVNMRTCSANTETKTLFLDCNDRSFMALKGMERLKNLCKGTHKLLRNVLELEQRPWREGGHCVSSQGVVHSEDVGVVCAQPHNDVQGHDMAAPLEPRVRSCLCS